MTDTFLPGAPGAAGKLTSQMVAVSKIELIDVVGISEAEGKVYTLVKPVEELQLLPFLATLLEDLCRIIIPLFLQLNSPFML